MGWGSAMINGTGKPRGKGTQWKGCFRNDTSCDVIIQTVVQVCYPWSWRSRMEKSCPGERDPAVRGGMGAIRIKFIEELNMAAIMAGFITEQKQARVEENLEKEKNVGV